MPWRGIAETSPACKGSTDDLRPAGDCKTLQVMMIVATLKWLHANMHRSGRILASTSDAAKVIP